MNIAVAGVSEVGDEGIVPETDFFDLTDQFGNTRARHDDIFVDL